MGNWHVWLVRKSARTENDMLTLVIYFRAFWVVQSCCIHGLLFKRDLLNGRRSHSVPRSPHKHRWRVWRHYRNVHLSNHRLLHVLPVDDVIGWCTIQSRFIPRWLIPDHYWIGWNWWKPKCEHGDNWVCSGWVTILKPYLLIFWEAIWSFSAWAQQIRMYSMI